MVSVWLSKLKVPITLILIEILFLVLFGFFVDYDSEASPEPYTRTRANVSTEDKSKNMVHDYYPMFQDVHVMMFIGFGFLMMFLKRYGFSSVGLNMLLAAITIQWSTLVGGLIHYHGNKFTISIISMITADFASAAVLITFGALLGKTSPMQMIVVTMFEVILFAANEYVGLVKFQVVDVGGSMFVHAFGAYFGLAISRVLHNPEVEKSTKEGSVYHSDMFAVIGSVFLWMFWPSFNSALAIDDAQHRAVLNTYFALAACCVVSFAISSLVDKNGRFDMVHIQNATLAGGVAVGTSADLMIQPYGAIIIGSLAGFVSVIGYKYITPFLRTKLKIHDTCGVNNLHGMPAILAGIIGAIVVSMADMETYGYTLYRQFPAMAPNASSSIWTDLECCVEKIPGKGRSAGEQAGYQILALVVTLVVALVGGTIVGLILKVCSFLGQPSGDRFFEDSLSWHVPEDSGNTDMTSVISRVISQIERNKSVPNKAEESMAPLLEGSFNRGDVMLDNLNVDVDIKK
uniref:Ammonium transporter AmtB-like domain-containing protein n=1 Tax=Arion vulgaris TaxID=1028688 RepID=A0A0B7A560_9EUPU